MPKKTGATPRRPEPLPRADFDHFRKSDFAPLVEDVKVLKEDVKVLKEDVKVLKEDVKVLKRDVLGLKTDMRSLRKEFQEAQGLAEARHQEIITTLDQIVTMFQGVQDKTIVHDVRIGDLEERVGKLEQA